MVCSATLTPTDQQQSVPQHCPVFERHHRMWPEQVSSLALFVTADDKQASRVQFSAGGRARSRGFKTISEQAAAFSVLALEKPTACKCLDICSTHTHMFLCVCGWVCDWVNVSICGYVTERPQQTVIRFLNELICIVSKPSHLHIVKLLCDGFHAVWCRTSFHVHSSRLKPCHQKWWNPPISSQAALHVSS